MEEMIESLKKELAATKEELEWYKQKDDSDKIDDIPEELVESQPLKCLEINGASRVKLTNSTKLF